MLQQDRKDKNFWTELVMAFFVTTAGICILEGMMGMLFFPEASLGYDAFFSPPLFGLFSVLFGLVNYSKKELTVRQVLLRRGIHLLLIEGLVFGLNYAAGVVFAPFVSAVLAVSIAAVFIMVYAVLYLNDRRNAEGFNRQLKKFQQEKGLE